LIVTILRETLMQKRSKRLFKNAERNKTVKKVKKRDIKNLKKT